MKKNSGIVMVVIVVVLLMIKGKGLLEDRKSEAANEVLPVAASISVSVVKPTQGVLEHKATYLSQIASDKSITLSSKLAGYVEQVFVEESQKVKKGDVLVQIDQMELESTIQALRATLTVQQDDLALAKSIYARNVKLFRIGGLAKEQLDISKVALQNKQATLENTKQKIEQQTHQLSYLKIVAPFDAEVDAVLLHEGDLAASGKPILSLSNGVKKLIFSYPPEDASIQKGLEVWAENEPIGSIKALYTTSSNGLAKAEVELNSTLDLPVGSSLTIDVLTKKSKGCIVPSDTVLHKKEGSFVMMYEKGKFTPFHVTIEMQEDQQMLVSPCPTSAVAKASEVKLSQLPAYDNVEITGAQNE